MPSSPHYSPKLGMIFNGKPQEGINLFLFQVADFMYQKVQSKILLNNYTEKKILLKICWLNCMGGIVEASSETTATTSTLFVLDSITISIKENIITKIKRSTGCPP